MHSFQCTKENERTGALVASKGEKRQTGGKSCSLQFDLKILSGSFTIMLQGKFRTSISELICKHRVLPEAAEAGHFTFPFSQRELSGRYRHTMLHQTGEIPRDFCGKVQFKFRGSKDKCCEKHVAAAQPPLLLLHSLPLGFAYSRFHVKAKCILLLSSGLKLKSGFQ